MWYLRFKDGFTHYYGTILSPLDRWVSDPRFSGGGGWDGEEGGGRRKRDRERGGVGMGEGEGVE